MGVEDSKIEEILFIKISAKSEELQKNTSKSIKNGNTIRPWYTWFRMPADSCFLHMRFIGLFALVDAPAAYPIKGWTGVAALSHVQCEVLIHLPKLLNLKNLAKTVL
ncbi:uncharacterized protein LOC128128184 isoform X2 [Lactuca sativa]|uniref:uncharacterized protein LOC128128184 isoform X2 n=1 Tax=Lactuca sativa TaxID=4236 RepID=UPI0022AEAD0E|nr:uncharacterized protein LOC128128184 isoform X2 [Lactuca sativa]